ncbi:RNA polymerase sigma factor [Melioribacteraceae bacterium 4301-Me]|uniref:RNA polymerase sigma factor n=1 Tax=Pyranulibacter aquaticus TaxID=3163344 RepID=UPI00359815DD
MILKSIRYQLLLQQYKNRIYSYSLYMLKDKMDAEDVTQEVLIKMWLNLGKFNMTAAASWIMKTTHNLCIDYLRKRNVETKRNWDVEQLSEQLISSNKTEDNPLTAAHYKLAKEKIKEAIIRLPEQLKSIFVLYEINGLKYKEISKILDIPINSVRVYLLRARRKLQEELKCYEPKD